MKAAYPGMTKAEVIDTITRDMKRTADEIRHDSFSAIAGPRTEEETLTMLTGLENRILAAVLAIGDGRE